MCPITKLIARSKGHYLGSFPWRGSWICIHICALKVCSYICLPDFLVELAEFAVYSVADDHMWSHLKACSPLQVFLYQPAHVSGYLYSPSFVSFLSFPPTQCVRHFREWVSFPSYVWLWSPLRLACAWQFFVELASRVHKAHFHVLLSLGKMLGVGWGKNSLSSSQSWGSWSLDWFTHEGAPINGLNLLIKNGQLSATSEGELNSKW